MIVKSKSSSPAQAEGAMLANVKSATRVLSIFEYFEKLQAPRTLSEISQDLGYPVSSTLALLRSVETMGYLNYDQRDKTYSPSIRLAVLGQWIHDKLFAGSAVVQMMEFLAARTGESILLSIQNGLQVQHIRVIHTAHSLSYAPPVGTLRPLLRSAAGRVLLTQMTNEEIEKIVKRINTLKLDEGRIFDLQTVLEDVRNTKKAGFAYSANVFVKGAAIVTVALPQQSGDTMMALGVAGPSSRVDEASIPDVLSQIKSAVKKFL